VLIKFLRVTRKEISYSDETLTFASYSNKNSECCLSNRVAVAAMTSASEEKWRPFNCFFFQSGRAKDLSASVHLYGSGYRIIVDIEL